MLRSLQYAKIFSPKQHAKRVHRMFQLTHFEDVNELCCLFKRLEWESNESDRYQELSLGSESSNTTIAKQ